MRARRIMVVVALVLAFPASAQAAPFTDSPFAEPFARSSQVCPCVVIFVGEYTSNAYGARTVVQRVLERRGVRWPTRRRVNNGIYDYERGGYGTKPNWCLRNKRACRAVIACVAAAGGYLVNAPKVLSQRTLARNAAKSCAVAAAASLAAP